MPKKNSIRISPKSAVPLLRENPARKGNRSGSRSRSGLRITFYPEHPESKNAGVHHKSKGIFVVKIQGVPAVKTIQRQGHNAEHIQQVDQENSGGYVNQFYFPGT